MRQTITKLLMAFFVAASLAGCASGPTPQDIANADYGTPVEKEFTDAQLKSYFEGHLKDPYSAQYEFGVPEKGYMISSSFEGRQLYAGYIVTARVNAKNSYGGYVGMQTYQFLFQNGKLVRGNHLSPSGLANRLF
ncbi:MAG: hypothetical protein ACTIOG_09290 [Pseudomonas helleri]|uniref:hypothetical protein n=1 Tax=Pseudomonas helleri TaxID=1608996 RepID=UPI003FD6BA51